MTKRVIHSLVEKAVLLDLVQEENADIYEYGVADMVYSIFTWGVFLIVGLCINMFWQMLLFMVVHIPFRIYAGGLHFATRFRCFCASLVIFAFVFVLPYFFTVTFLAVAILWLMPFCIIITSKLAPVEDLHKPLNTKERSHHGKVSLAICLVGLAVIVVLYFLHYYQMVYFMGAAILVVSFQLVLGFVKNQLYQLKK